MSTSPPLVAVLGAGAAGLLAAIHAAKGGARVVLLERTPDGGRKILISGGGRCNVLPSHLDTTRYVTASSPNSLRMILRGWPLEEQRQLLRGGGRLAAPARRGDRQALPGGEQRARGARRVGADREGARRRVAVGRRSDRPRSAHVRVGDHPRRWPDDSRRRRDRGDRWALRPQDRVGRLRLSCPRRARPHHPSDLPCPHPADARPADLCGPRRRLAPGDHRGEERDGAPRGERRLPLHPSRLQRAGRPRHLARRRPRSPRRGAAGDDHGAVDRLRCRDVGSVPRPGRAPGGDRDPPGAADAPRRSPARRRRH
ncbi:MAG: NAD(P)/FAD-dependent oxidoreductase [Gemmatimonadetes bacterium]|nr:NAD(P)/FAD-dependent oxidoreductase [Gemmatimonadota bacterium]